MQNVFKANLVTFNRLLAKTYMKPILTSIVWNDSIYSSILKNDFYSLVDLCKAVSLDKGDLEKCLFFIFQRISPVRAKGDG